MEILFENTYLYDERIAREYMKHSILRSPRLYIIIAMFVVIAGMLCLIKRFDYAAIFGVLFIAWIIISIVSFRQGVRRMTRKYTELSGGEPMVVRFDFGDYGFITNMPSSGAILVPYRDVKRISADKKTIMITVRGGAKYAIPRDSFTKGDPDSFLPFLKTEVRRAKALK